MGHRHHRPLIVLEEAFEGNYADYEVDRKRRLGVEADRPTRIKYKRLA